MFKDVITLIKVDNDKKDDLGTGIPKIVSENEVFASKKSVRSSEFYQAHQSGMEVTTLFKLWTIDYDEERVVKHYEKYFTVVRTYEKGDFIEISAIKRKGLFQEATR